MVRNLAAADELPDEFAFQIRIENLHSFVALNSAERSLVRRKYCFQRCQSSEDGTFVALVHWMDETLIREELLFLSRQLTGSSFMSDLNLVCKSQHFYL